MYVTTLATQSEEPPTNPSKSIPGSCSTTLFPTWVLVACDKTEGYLPDRWRRNRRPRHRTCVLLWTPEAPASLGATPRTPSKDAGTGVGNRTPKLSSETHPSPPPHHLANGHPPGRRPGNPLGLKEEPGGRTTARIGRMGRQGLQVFRAQNCWLLSLIRHPPPWAHLSWLPAATCSPSLPHCHPY